MSKNQKIIIGVIVALIVIGGAYLIINKKSTGKKINLSQTQQGPANQGNVSPFTGLPCDNWNRRPLAIMQPADVSTRPAAGFSDADIVLEMPVITATITRLMAIYVCGNPDDVGSIRSARHDFVPVAKGWDAIFVHWGRSNIDKFKELLNGGVIDDMNCNNDAGKSAQQYCYRKSMADLAKVKAFPNVAIKSDDTGYAKFSELLKGAQAFGYRMTDQFSGYPHQDEAPADQRSSGGRLHIGYPGPFSVDYNYNKDTNSYTRIWGEVPDTDRNNGKPITPKNIAVIFAKSEQIEGQYNNVQLGDPWYDTDDSGEGRYYFNGQEIVGSWKKDKSNINSKLTFYDNNGQEIKFVPGQIWVEVVEPGTGLKWTPQS